MRLVDRVKHIGNAINSMIDRGLTSSGLNQPTSISSQEDSMRLLDRVKYILLTPKTEWATIKSEQTTPVKLLLDYVAILALIPAVATIIGRSLIGMPVRPMGTIPVPIGFSIGAGVFRYLSAFAIAYGVAFLANELAPSFGGQKNLNMALKVVVYSLTPMWIVGIFEIIPPLIEFRISKGTIDYLVQGNSEA